MPRSGAKNIKVRNPNEVWADTGTYIVGCSTLCVDAGSRFYRQIMVDKIYEGCVCQKKPGHFVKQLHQYLHNTVIGTYGETNGFKKTKINGLL